MTRIRLKSFIVLLILTVSVIAVGQRPNQKREARNKEFAELIQRASALDEKTYSPDTTGQRESNNDHLDLREAVLTWAKKYKVVLRRMTDLQHLRFQGESMVSPRYKHHVDFYGMTCFLTGYEFSHSLHHGYYSCTALD